MISTIDEFWLNPTVMTEHWLFADLVPEHSQANSEPLPFARLHLHFDVNNTADGTLIWDGLVRDEQIVKHVLTKASGVIYSQTGHLLSGCTVIEAVAPSEADGASSKERWRISRQCLSPASYFLEIDALSEELFEQGDFREENYQSRAIVELFEDSGKTLWRAVLLNRNASQAQLDDFGHRFLEILSLERNNGTVTCGKYWGRVELEK